MNQTDFPMRRGVFWLIGDTLLAFPFDGSITKGIAKSGNTYNHRLLWEAVRPDKHPWNYYPRGRVEINPKGIPIIYMSPHISQEHLAEIRRIFGLHISPVIRIDTSLHYHCFLDD